MLRYKGRIISQKKLNHLHQQAINLEKARSVLKSSPAPSENVSTPKAGERRKLSPEPVDENFTPKRITLEEPEENVVEEEEEEAVESLDDCGRGRRIVEIAELAKNLWCCSCKECLSLENIETERRQGFGSVFTVRCRKCAVLNIVPSGKQHNDVLGRRTLFDVNAKLPVGMINAGVHHAQLEKLCAAMNMPCPTFQTYKRYERTMGQYVEKVAKNSCKEAAAEERELTIKNKALIEQFLPEHLRDNFIIPEPEARAPSFIDMVDIAHVISFDHVVRIMVSWDMGWSKRGAGLTYDSLNGFGAFVGNFTQKCVDYFTCNRKCSMCDAGSHPLQHNCRLNYFGSAKGMEAYAAKKLITESSILKGLNLEVGVLVTDEDSSTIAACREAVEHEIVKLSDKNHSSKGVKKILFAKQKQHEELTKEAIGYLHKCFTYALSQNKGNSEKMSVALRSIPLHAFNDHDICGEWCGFKKDPLNYKHTVIYDGFRDPKLKEELIDVFNKLANNSNKLVSAASSNSNESLNSMMARKCPKNTCYSLSQSADYRFSAVVAKKNYGESFTQKAMVMNGILSPSSPFLSRFIKKTDKLTDKNRKLFKCKKFKAKRILKVKTRANIKYRKESQEGRTYESNCTLLEEDGIAPLPFCEEDIDGDCLVDREGEGVIVLFDLETTGFQADCDILQIGARCGDQKFSVFGRPTKGIDIRASKIHGLTYSSGDLYKNGQRQEAVSQQAAISDFLTFLESLKSKVYLCAHNIFSFDWPRMFVKLKLYNELDRFKSVVKGLIDSLAVIKNSRSKGSSNKLGDLARELGVSDTGAHDALADVTMLHLVLQKLNFSVKDLIESSLDVSFAAHRIENSKKLRQELCNVLSKSMIDKFIKANVTVESLREAYNASKIGGLSLVLASVTKHKEVLRKLAAWCDKENVGPLANISLASNQSLQNAGPSTTVLETNQSLNVPHEPEPVERESSPDYIRDYIPDFDPFKELAFGDY